MLAFSLADPGREKLFGIMDGIQRTAFSTNNNEEKVRTLKKRKKE
jgi:hypothetical protein